MVLEGGEGALSGSTKVADHPEQSRRASFGEGSQSRTLLLARIVAPRARIEAEPALPGSECQTLRVQSSLEDPMSRDEGLARQFAADADAGAPAGGDRRASGRRARLHGSYGVSRLAGSRAHLRAHLLGPARAAGPSVRDGGLPAPAVNHARL